MLISDWSSDVCSSDLLSEAARTLPCDLDIAAMDGAKPPCRKRIRRGFDPAAVGDAIGVDAGDHLRFRQPDARVPCWTRSEEHTSELQSLMRISYAVFCLKKKK